VPFRPNGSRTASDHPGVRVKRDPGTDAIHPARPKLVGTGAVGSPVLQGYSVALSGDGHTTIVGGENDTGGIGAAWIFTRSHGVWAEEAKLVTLLHGSVVRRRGLDGIPGTRS
jgi:hypothetical protein